jgi:hypothetical protein
LSGIEGIGEAVTGGLASRAVEPGAGEADGHAHEHPCLNCGTDLHGAYCHSCGQKGHLHRTLGAFWHDLIHGVFHFEGKIWRTLPMLIWRPGELTRRYIEGERARFVSPMALFLFSVFLMFAVFSSIGGPFQAVKDTSTPAAESPRDKAASPAPAGGKEAAEPAGNAAEGGAAAKDKATRRNVNINVPWEWLRKAIKKWAENPSLMVYKLQSNAYKFSWALIPISVPFLALLFLWRRRHQRLYDHTVFVTYSISFASMLLIVLSPIRQAGVPEDFVVLALLLIMPLHMFRQLKGAYQLRFFSALWRTIALLFFSNVAIMLFLVLALALGAM